MTTSLINLSTQDLEALASALRSGRVREPFLSESVGRFVHSSLADQVAQDLTDLVQAQFQEFQIAVLLGMIVSERKTRRHTDEVVELVTTGPEAPGITNRDTSVVVRELFAEAESSVLVAGYAVYQGNQVFEALAERMRDLATLDVKLFLDIKRPDRDTSADSLVVRKFMSRLRKHQWPEDCPLPNVFYDPRSLALDSRSSLHAKSIVVDRKVIFVSSANFTNAGQERNIEVGLLVRSPILAEQLTHHFMAMLDAGLMHQANT